MTEQSSRPVKEQMLADRTGRSNVGRNLLSGWAVELVVIVSGFVTPRLIDTNLGQAKPSSNNSILSQAR